MATLTSFEQAREYLHSFVNFEQRGFRRHFADVVNLETIGALLEALGNPQRRFHALHLAGTKGKGSTSSMCEAALREAGYRTGLYTSPHLLSMCERIRLQGQPVSEARMTELVSALQPAVDSLADRVGLNPPSFFELYTAMAFLAFAEAEVDIAVVETGLGGRLDATNVVAPLVTAITTIGFDHTDILGETLQQIAGEKAGIMKPGVPVVLAPQPPEAEAVLLARVEALGVEVRRAPEVRQASRDQRLPIPAGDLPRVRQNVTLETGGAGLKVRLPLLGRHQQTNLAVAWAAVEALGERGFPVSAKQFARGMESLRWPGRFEIAEVRPWLVLDCAHNALSLQALAGTLRDSLRYQRLVLVFGMSADKDIAEAAAQIAPLADQVILTQAMMHRAQWASELTRATWPLWRTAPHVRWTVAESLALARELAGPQDCICVTGSIFVVSEALEALGRAVC